MTTYGRLESVAIVVPASGWAFDFSDASPAGGTLTVPAGTYSPTTLLAEFISLLNGASTVTWAGAIANGEAGSGVVTITADEDYSITWGSTDLRDVLGFAGLGYTDNTGTTTGTLGMHGLWLPDSPLVSPYASGDAGHWEGGPSQTISPQGVTATITRPSRVRVGPFRWTHVTLARARQYSESGAPRSFERFVRDTMFAQVSYFRPGGAVRLYWDAGNSSSYVEFYPKAPPNTATTAAIESSTLYYGVAIEGTKAT